MEVRDDRVARPVVPGTLIEFVAVRLLVERIALRHLCDRATPPLQMPLSELRSYIRSRIESHATVSAEQRSFYVFQLAQVMGWNPRSLYQLTAREWATLVAEIEAFPPLARRRGYQLAFEHRLLGQEPNHPGTCVERQISVGLLHRCTRRIVPSTSGRAITADRNIWSSRILRCGDVFQRDCRRSFFGTMPDRRQTQALGRRRYGLSI